MIGRFRSTAVGLLSLTAIILSGNAVDCAYAEDRIGGFGVGVAVPLELEPSTSRGDVIYTIDLTYYWLPRLALFTGVDIGVEGAGRVNLNFGPRAFLFRDGEIKPYFSAEFLYFVSPKNDIGWRASAGGEWNLRRYTDLDNVRVFAQTGVSQYLLDNAPNILGWELLRFGSSWSF